MATETEKKSRPISKIWAFFKSAYTGQYPAERNGLTSFKNEWVALSDKDRDAIANGIEDGSLTY
jgi:hypothetical protein